MLTKYDAYDTIAENPGITSAELARQFGIGVPSAESHTRILRTEGYIASRTPGGNKTPAEWVVICPMPPEGEPVQRIIPAKGAPALKRLGVSCVWELGAR